MRGTLGALHLGFTVEPDVYEHLLIFVAAFLVRISGATVAAIGYVVLLCGSVVRAPAVQTLDDAQRVFVFAMGVAPSL